MANYIKDSANNYTLYVYQGEDYSLDIDCSVFGISNNSTLTFYSSLKRHHFSDVSTDISIVKKNATTITLNISSDITSKLLESNYVFDVIYKDSSNKVHKAFAGVVSISNSVSSI